MSFLSHPEGVTEADPWRTVDPNHMTSTVTDIAAQQHTSADNLTQRLFGTASSGSQSPQTPQLQPVLASDTQPTIQSHVPPTLEQATINNNPINSWGNGDDRSSTVTANIWSNSTVLDNQITTSNQSLSETSSQRNSEVDLQEWTESVRKTFNPLSPNVITIEELAEREGLLFKHINYNVIRLQRLPNEDITPNGASSTPMSVVRRYSDFVWLQDVLLKRYPFRLIPELPPKKIGSQKLDPIFLNKRRLGLIRFINHVVRHPVLNKDDLLLTFLTVPTDISNWRKQTKDNYDTSDEFMDKRIEGSFMKLWSKNISEQWNDVANNILKIIDTWHKITMVIQRHERRLNQIRQENLLLNDLIDDFTQMTPILYPIENITNDETLPQINNDLSIVRNHLKDVNSLNIREMDDNIDHIIPRLKNFIDMLISLKDLFERYKIMATNNIPQLQRHVQLDLEKLESMKGKPDASGIEYDKIKTQIHRDRRSIAKQLNRAWLIRKCILHEYTIFQETQFMISDLFKKWVQVNSNYTELNMNQLEKLASQIADMPVAREE